MFIFVRNSDHVIVGCSVKQVNEADMARQGNSVYEVDDSEFSYTMLGQKLKAFNVIE